MKRIFLTGFLVLGLLSSLVFAQMNSGQGGGMMDGGRMGGWGWGSGYAWGYGIIILVIVILVLSYMMKKK